MADREPRWYYIRLNEDNDNAITIDYCYGDYWECSFSSDIVEVLDKVPTHDEYKKLKQSLKHSLGDW